MKKTMYIPRWQECNFENLTCERIVVNGSLHVKGSLKTKHISGNGFVYAELITATSITAHTVFAGSIATDTLTAAHVNSYDIHAVTSMAVSVFVAADNVRTGHITYADAEIRDLQADEAIKLPPRQRGLLRTLFASFVRAKWAELTSRKVNEESGRNNGNADDHDIQEFSARDTAAPVSFVSPDLEEAARLLNDPEFLRIRALYKLTQETGDSWQIVPKAEPSASAVTAFTAA